MKSIYSQIKNIEDHAKCASVETELNIEQCLKQHLNIIHDAEEHDISYLSFILCENGKDIRIERYADKHWFAVGLYIQTCLTVLKSNYIITWMQKMHAK